MGVSAEGTRESEDESSVHPATETEGARVVGASVESPVRVVEVVDGVWSDPTRREGPYPSHSRSREESSDGSQHSQSIA